MFPSDPYFDPTPTGYDPPNRPTAVMRNPPGLSFGTPLPVPGPPPVGGTPPDWLAWLSRVLIFLGVVYAAFVRPDAKPTDTAPLEAAVKRLEAGQVQAAKVAALNK